MGKRDRKDSDAGSEGSVEAEKYGKPHQYDPHFNGPIKNRGCTDIICCLLFVAFAVGQGLIAAFAFTTGNPNNIILPVDDSGNICGDSPGLENQTYLFYFDYLECLSTNVIETVNCPTHKVCVASCPTETYAITTKYTLQLDSSNPSGVNWNDFICVTDIDPQREVADGSTINDLIENDLCANYYVESKINRRRCVPSFLLNASQLEDMNSNYTPNGRPITQDNREAATSMYNFFTQSRQIENMVSDFWETWPFILAALVITGVVAFICLVLMRWLTSIIIGCGMIAALLALAWGSYFTWNEWLCYKNSEPGCTPENINDPNFDYYSLDSYLKLSNTWLIFALVLSILALIVLIVILTMCKRFRVALNIMEIASDSLPHMCFTLFWPIVPFFLVLGYVFFWAVIVVYLASASDTTFEVTGASETEDVENGTSCDQEEFSKMNYTFARCQPVAYGVPNFILYLQIYNLLALFWMTNFIKALGEMVLAGAFASYYWAFEKPDDIPRFPLFASFYRAVRYHIGSLAYGALIISIVNVIQTVLQYVEDATKDAQNCLTKFFFKCCSCCLWCLEKFLRFINRNAYIDIAVYGHSFCHAARHVFNLLMRNILRVMVLNSVTSAMLFLIKITISVLVTVGAFYFFNWASTATNENIPVPTVNYIWAPVAIIGLLSYAICSMFFSVFDMAVDTMFISFLEDLERNDGSAMKPYYMPKGLESLIR